MQQWKAACQSRSVEETGCFGRLFILVLCKVKFIDNMNEYYRNKQFFILKVPCYSEG